MKYTTSEERRAARLAQKRADYLKHKKKRQATALAWRIRNKKRKALADRAWYEANKNRKRAYDIEYRKKNSDRLKRQRDAYRKTARGKLVRRMCNQRRKYAHPGKRKASLASTNAVRDGRITRGPCIVCGCLQTEGHHPDYRKKLLLVWLCKKHHQELHRRKYATSICCAE